MVIDRSQIEDGGEQLQFATLVMWRWFISGEDRLTSRYREICEY